MQQISILIHLKRVHQFLLKTKGVDMKKIILAMWQSWNEARLAYSKRYAQHQLGS